jgi:hypothetical protein
VAAHTCLRPITTAPPSLGRRCLLISSMRSDALTIQETCRGRLPWTRGVKFDGDAHRLLSVDSIDGPNSVRVAASARAAGSRRQSVRSAPRRGELRASNRAGNHGQIHHSPGHDLQAGQPQPPAILRISSGEYAPHEHSPGASPSRPATLCAEAQHNDRRQCASGRPRQIHSSHGKPMTPDSADRY